MMRPFPHLQTIHGDRPPRRTGSFEWEWSRGTEAPADYVMVRAKCIAHEVVHGSLVGVGDVSFWVLSFDERFDSTTDLHRATVQILEAK